MTTPAPLPEPGNDLEAERIEVLTPLELERRPGGAIPDPITQAEQATDREADDAP